MRGLGLEDPFQQLVKGYLGIQRVQVMGQLKSNFGESNGKENATCNGNWIVGMVCRGPFNQNRVWGISSHCSLRCYKKDSEGERRY